MARDDYDVIVYRVLVYLYACLKRKTIFNESSFRSIVIKNINEDYFDDVLAMMQREGLVEGLAFVRDMCGINIRASDYCDMRITADGIHYLSDNAKMKKVGEFLADSAEAIAKIAIALLA